MVQEVHKFIYSIKIGAYVWMLYFKRKTTDYSNNNNIYNIIICNYTTKTKTTNEKITASLMLISI